MTTIVDSSPVASEGLAASGDAGWQHPAVAATVVFYAKPLISKWLRMFKKPTIQLLSPAPLDDTFIIKKLKPTTLHQQTYETPLSGEEADLLMLIDPPEPGQLGSFVENLKKGGALILVIPNGARVADWVHQIEALDLADYYSLGFHRKGAIAWWPWEDNTTVLVGEILDGLAPFLPGRYQAGLRFGRWRMLRAFKRDDVTQLS